MSLSAMPTPKYEYVTSSERAKNILSELDNYDILGVDTETTSLDVFKAKLCLIQIAAEEKNYVFDMRYDTAHSDIHPSLFVPCFYNENIIKIFQNASYDTKIFKLATGSHIRNIYDPMLAEQLLHLGLHAKAGLKALVARYLFMEMPKEPGKTFSDYEQTYKPFQLEYAINDVVGLDLIRKLQLKDLAHEGLLEVAQLEFDFVKPLIEMELNGINIDKDKWRLMLEDIKPERDDLSLEIIDILAEFDDQTSLFGASSINIDSQKQLLKALRRYGLKDLENTDVATLSNIKEVPVIEKILEYRALTKIIGTYGEALLNKIHPKTGRLHTDFKQLLATGRLSSSNPNLQNIPKKQKYRTGFIADPGYSLIKSDAAGCELRILGNLSKDPIFIDSYKNGIDLHTKTAADIYGVSMANVTTEMRGAAKTINFGIIYGLSKFGLSRRLKISERDAQDLINSYFDNYKGIKKFLDKSAEEGINKLYSRSISGRKRYYYLPPHYDEDFKKISSGIKRRSMNMPVQASSADHIKKAMIYIVERIEKGGYDARLVLTVHDEVIVECNNSDVEEVSKLVPQALIDAFDFYFEDIKMEADSLIGPAWMKEACSAIDEKTGKKCGHNVSKFVEDKKYKTKLVCAKCGSVIK